MTTANRERCVHPPGETKRAFGSRLALAAAYVGRLVLVGVVAGALILVPGFTQRGLDDYLHPAKIPNDRNPASVGLTYGDATLLTADGLHLAAWYLPADGPDTLIVVHGLGTNRSSMLEIAADLQARKYRVLLLDLRAHGDSEGNVSTLGVKEVRDIRAAVDFLRAQPEVDSSRIGIYGGSLGGAVALLAAGAIPELRAVVVDSTFASARWVVDHQLQSLLRLPDWFGPLLLTVGGVEAGISPDDAAPAVAASHLGVRPLLVIHGSEDGLFKVDNARMIYESASGPRDLWVLEGIGHTQAYGTDPRAYIDRLDAFFTSGL